MEFLRQKLASIGYRSYQDYINSRHWLDLRQKYKNSDLPQNCKACNSPAYNLHHTTYKNLGRENLEDFMPLCTRCHRTLHCKLKKHDRPVEHSQWALEEITPIILKKRQSRTPDDFFKIALKVCGSHGYPIHDIEYESAVNLGVATALKIHDPTKGDLCTLCCLLARRECSRTRIAMSKWVKQDAAGAGRGYCEKAIPTPIPLFDFETLSFVARHGRTRAARMLGLHVPKINELLTDIARRMNQSRDDQPVAQLTAW